MRIDARHLLQHSFAISNVRDARGWLLFLCIQMLVERFNNCIFNVSSRNAGNRSDSCCFGFSVQERKRDIVAIAYAGLGGVGRNHAMTDIVEQKSGQQMVARVPRRGSSSPLIRELLLDRIE